MCADTVTSPLRGRTVILYASPHLEGHTAKKLSAYLGETGLEPSFTFIAYQERPAPCLDCGYCKTQESCVQPDLDELMGELARAETVIVASPIYNLSFPAPMKALLDRLQRYYYAYLRAGSLPVRRKRGILILTAGSKMPSQIEMLRRQTELAFRLLGAELCEVHTEEGTDPPGLL